MPNARPTLSDTLSPRQITTWFTGLGAPFFAGHTSAEEMRSSVSWRVTAPIRRIRARERLGKLRARKLPVLEPGGEQVQMARLALERRLRAVAPLLLGTAPVPEAQAEDLLVALVEQIHPRDETPDLWLLLTAVSGCIPDESFLRGLLRDIRGTDAAGALQRILAHSGVWMTRHDSFLREIDVVTDHPVVFVDFTARHGFNSGVQRVTREIMRAWTAHHRETTLVALSDSGVALRALDTVEEARVRDWDQTKSGEHTDGPESDARLIVPWQTVVFVPENTHESASMTLSSIARFSRNRTVVLGYDAIPATSGSTVGAVERLRSAAYLSFLKHVDHIVAISASAGAEFSGFTDALVTQGLPGPRVTSVLLPLERIPAHPGDVADDDVSPMVLAVGSNERRKNHLAVLFAAEVLWRQGIEFSLVLMGGAGSPEYTDVHDVADALITRGRALSVRHDVSETHLAQAYLRARFTVFLSVHEGYGLPVAESLAAGTPVLATSFGSTAEIAAGGGCVLVDPRDDDAVVASMRKLVVDDALITELESAIAARDDPSWTDYANAIWDAVTDPEPTDQEGLRA